MPAYCIDPLQDQRWGEFLQSHPQASVFHTLGWLEALRRAYGYEPMVWTTSAPSEPLTDGIVLCQINSWLTGSRLVSLPFADHCQPLVSDSSQLRILLTHLLRLHEQKKLKYVELRPVWCDGDEIEKQEGLKKSTSFYYHVLDLRLDLSKIYEGFHKSCIERKIRRAQREGLEYEHGFSEMALRKFHFLLTMTRRRHGIPPQPLSWFRNLAACFKDKLKIGLACKNGQPLAGILTLSYKDKLVYKYGCSDSRFHNLGGMPFLFWQTIQDGKRAGAQELDLGRSDIGDTGLIDFKTRLGAAYSTLNYYRYPPESASSSVPKQVNLWGISQHLPSFFIKAVGNLLYRHAG